MKIFNITTRETETLSHPSHQTDVMADLTASDDNIVWSEKREMHEASQETLDWWNEWAQADAKLEAMKEEIDSELCQDLLEHIDGCDMGDQPAYGIAQLEEWAEENGKEFREYSDGCIGLVSK